MRLDRRLDVLDGIAPDGSGAKFGSIRRVFRILELVSRREGLTAKLLARELGVSLSTCYYLINILIEEGYLEKNPTHKGCRIGVAVSTLHERSARADLGATAEPVLEELAQRTGRHAYLRVLSDGAVTVSEVKSPCKRGHAGIREGGRGQHAALRARVRVRGLAAAHSVHNGLTSLEGTHHYWHGEKVAFGVISMLMLEDRPCEVVEEVVDFCLKIGLPVCLEDIGVGDASREELERVAEASCAEGETIHNMPVAVNPARSLMLCSPPMPSAASAAPCSKERRTCPPWPTRSCEAPGSHRLPRSLDPASLCVRWDRGGNNNEPCLAVNQKTPKGAMQ